jgi:hypothetical protein
MVGAPWIRWHFKAIKGTLLAVHEVAGAHSSVVAGNLQAGEQNKGSGGMSCHQANPCGSEMLAKGFGVSEFREGNATHARVDSADIDSARG